MQHLKDDSEAPCMNISDEFGLWHASARRFPVVANKGSAVSLRKVRKSSTVWQAKYTKKQIREGGRQGQSGHQFATKHCCASCTAADFYTKTALLLLPQTSQPCQVHIPHSGSVQ
ncbi:hypothetical protein BB8028_0006g05780 [Beauveria bassiana]|uniref:Uncharacterized protein n=1 Tax=Beauveria bassiana TaxID=176275 RepID=A0A2S7YJH5_BEABA|nr:hypothetical protein BB8028_0006g05780 [Beauveria bassiana]